MFVKKIILLLCLYSILQASAIAAPNFVKKSPHFNSTFLSDPAALCQTAKNTREYLDKGSAYDPQVIHSGKILPISLHDLKATLDFICLHKDQLKDPDFIKEHFDFIQWRPDLVQAKLFSKNKPLVKNIPSDRILMTRYYVHSAKGSLIPSKKFPYALYGIPADEKDYSIEEANKKPGLLRFQYGKQAILKGALQGEAVKPLVYLQREDLEAALLQGTIVVDTGEDKKIYNVSRVNNIAYDRKKSPYEQERYWYFKEVNSIKGYGKDAEYKISVYPEVTFAADLEQFGLGKILLIQFNDNKGKSLSRIGIFADTGGAFAKNLYQIDFLSGVYPSKEICYKTWRGTPDYVSAYFMVLKKKYIKA
ncbi:Uncharacterised protein (plasmid) [Legionella adelaidensis]|uniref:Lytic transglycosylase MltA domain-containing protein n=1 Tax=Legionella adelaidensis TaxID=45056 RepID=A0A0W0R266_9GAMM|nr:hypothetical protein Lade_1590 [Legionella adelaidensis]VEH85413.1 Uncharacterised protein [Legionella adelaidensis]